MIKVGITGPIGSGKTTVCKVWERLGAKIFFADEEAKKLMASDAEIRESLVKTFGTETFLDNGSLNKPHLIREAFEKERVNELNAIVHPAVAVAFEKFCRNSEKNGVEVAVKEAALLLNHGRPMNLDVIVIVESNREERIRRVKKRDDMDEQKFVQRDKKQPNFASLHQLADEIILNNGTLSELEEKSEKLFSKIQRINHLN